jgi:hypothetical protein
MWTTKKPPAITTTAAAVELDNIIIRNFEVFETFAHRKMRNKSKM